MTLDRLSALMWQMITPLHTAARFLGHLQEANPRIQLKQSCKASPTPSSMPPSGSSMSCDLTWQWSKQDQRKKDIPAACPALKKILPAEAFLLEKQFLTVRATLPIGDAPSIGSLALPLACSAEGRPFLHLAGAGVVGKSAGGTMRKLHSQRARDLRDLKGLNVLGTT